MRQGVLHNGPPLPVLTVGQRNNNYGNLRSFDPFVGKTGSNGYDIYDTPENGLRALARVLDTYSKKHGIKTISGLVDRYAPSGDNTIASRQNYKRALANVLGVGVDDEIDISAQRLPLMRGIINFENGKQLASDDMLEAAIAAADGTDEIENMAAQPDIQQGNQMANNYNGFGNPEDDWHQGNVADAQRMGANSFVQGILERLFLENQAKQRAAASMGISGNPSLDEGAEFTSIAPPTRFIGNPYMGRATQPQAPALSNAYSGMDNPEDEYFVGNINDAKNAAEKRRQRQMTLEEDYQMGKRTGQFIYEENIRRYEREYPQNPKPNAYAGMDNPEDDYHQSNVAEAERLSGDNRPASNYVGPYPMGSTQAPILDQSQSSAGVLSGNPAFTMMPPPPREVDANPQTNQRRNKSAMAFDPGIDFNEQLIRIGLAGVGGSAQGGLAGLSAMGDMYGAIQDANRSNALAAYEASIKAAKNQKTGLSDDDQAYLDKIDSTLFTMDEALGFLSRAQSGEGGGLTGFLDGTIGAGWDRMMGNPEAMGRRLLEQLRVDDALLRVAQTKGAISNHEMRLFLSPAPTKFDDEQVWIDWINQRRRAALRIKDRLTNGRQVAQSERATQDQINQYGQQGNDSEIDELVKMYS